MKFVVCLKRPRHPRDSTVNTEWKRHPCSPELLMLSSSRFWSLFEKLAPMFTTRYITNPFRIVDDPEILSATAP